ncbi:MAG: carboxypeptidase regulatory-like domain-containing protein, partial [Bryobacteraceae bacterium]|nr:carboxypeptidase regulatory-like domain-containing protein [Bryobacteraceae bacterium]
MQTIYLKCVRPVALLLLALLGSISASAQQAGSLKGTVTDPSGSSVPGAVIILRKAPSTELRTTTDAQGGYIFNNVPRGSWSLTVSRPGFAPYQIQDFEVNGASLADVRMEVSLEKQQVTVNDDTNQVTTDPNANVGALVLRGEDLEALSDDPDQLASDLQALAGPAAGPNGGQIFIDGFSGGQLPPKSSIREIRVNQNPFSAEYDRLGFGRIEIFTKPGSDKFRGQFMTMISDNVLNARNPFVETKPDFRSKFFDGSVSGPITQKSSFNLHVEHRGIDENALINATLLDASLT